MCRGAPQVPGRRWRTGVAFNVRDVTRALSVRHGHIQRGGGEVEPPTSAAPKRGQQSVSVPMWHCRCRSLRPSSERLEGRADRIVVAPGTPVRRRGCARARPGRRSRRWRARRRGRSSWRGYLKPPSPCPEFRKRIGAVFRCHRKSPCPRDRGVQKIVVISVSITNVKNR